MLQVVQDAQRWCYSVSGGSELPTLLHLADEALTQYIMSLQVELHLSSPVGLKLHHIANWPLT